MNLIVFNDFCSIGNCALKINIAVFLNHNIKSIPIPTKIFSATMNQKHSISFNLKEFNLILDSVEKNNFKIEYAYIGLVDDKNQLDEILKFIEKNKIKKVIFDPILGDNGRKYSKITEEQIEYYKEILKISEIITPNLTEAIILTDYKVDFEKITKKDVEKIAKKLNEMGAKKVIIKSFIKNNKINTLYFDSNSFNWYDIDFVDTKIYGTGDVFSSLITVEIIRGKNLKTSIPKIKQTIKKAIEKQNLKETLNEIEIENIKI